MPTIKAIAAVRERRTKALLAKLMKVLIYSPNTGQFTWSIDHNARARKGAQAGSPGGLGYRYICFDYEKFPEHHLAIAFSTGAWPKHQVDHEDHNPSNNKLKNLRLATQSQNNYNKKAVKGYQQTRNNRFRAYLQIEGRQITVGMFDTAEEASAAHHAAKAPLLPRCLV